MAWIRSRDVRRCGTCGIVVERWVLQNNHGHQVADATFCPVCYPDVKQVFAVFLDRIEGMPHLGPIVENSKVTPSGSRVATASPA
jgi:hypothetical protein